MILGPKLWPSWAMLGTKLAYNGSSTSHKKLGGQKKLQEAAENRKAMRITRGRPHLQREFGSKLGGKLRPSWLQKSIKMESKMTSKKEVEIKRGNSLFGEDRPCPGAPWEGDLGGEKNGSMD